MGCNEENKRGQSPFLYFDYSGNEKNERWKKGDCPLLFHFISPEGEKMPTFDRNITTNKVIVFILLKTGL